MTTKHYKSLLYKELSYQIQGAAIEVRKDFGPGHKESIYQNAFAEELKSRGINFEREKNIKIYSPKTKKVIGYYKPDFIIEGKVIIELKALEKIPKFLIDQLYDYLRNSEYELGYFINFSSPKLYIKRIIFTNDRKFSKLKNALVVVSSFLLVVFSVLLVVLSVMAFQRALAATNIDSTYRYAWNDVIGWIDFYSTQTITVSSAQLAGYADSSVGYIALDCATSPNGDICSTSNFKVSNDGNGYLSGWAWNDAIGWISFDSATAGSPYLYQVTINPSNGEFSGWAWNDVVGWISFNCSNTNSCSTSDYKVKTAWIGGPLTAELTSSIFDTGVSSGVALNTIMWQGNQPTGTSVKFQIASSNCSNGADNPPTCNSGSWTYRGPDGSNTTYYAPTGPGVPIQINLKYHNNHRYFRYKIFLTSDAGRTQSPRVDDVIINYSP